SHLRAGMSALLDWSNMHKPNFTCKQVCCSAGFRKTDLLISIKHYAERWIGSIRPSCKSAKNWNRTRPPGTRSGLQWSKSAHHPNTSSKWVADKVPRIVVEVVT